MLLSDQIDIDFVQETMLFVLFYQKLYQFCHKLCEKGYRQARFLKLTFLKASPDPTNIGIGMADTYVYM